jgi:hypothetical protein
MEKPLAERRSFLTDLAGCLSSAEAETRGGQLLTTALTNVVTAIDIEGTFNIARSCRNEGLVLKDPQSIYSPVAAGRCGSN